MYQLSRSIYRELAPEILADPIPPAHTSNHERVLRACEAAVYRLATDRHYFAKPSKTLFREIRIYFPICAQDHVYRVVDRYMTFARQWFEAQTTGATTSPATGSSAAPRPARARRASARRLRTTATARRISTSRTATC